MKATLTIASRTTPTISGRSGRSVPNSRRNEPRKSFGLAGGMPMPMPIIPGRAAATRAAQSAGRRAAGARRARRAGRAGSGARRGAPRAAHAAASVSDICEYTISR